VTEKAASNSPRRIGRALAVRLALAAGSVLTLVLTWSLMLGGSYKWKLFGIRVRAYDFIRPQPIGAALAAILLMYGWRQRAFRLLATALLAAFAMCALAAYARQAQPYLPAGDIALLESYTIDASRGELLVGAYSRFGWHHPGPIYFYILAPFYALADHRTVGLGAGALWINLGSLLALASTLLSAGRGRLASVTLALTAVYLFRVRDVLASPWNPHIMILPMMLLVVLSAALASGELVLMPVVALVATVIVQTHVGPVPAVLALTGCSAAAAIVFTPRSSDPAARTRPYRSVNLAMWVLAAAWFLPLVDQFGGVHGNLGELWRFFTSPTRHGQMFGAAFVAWGETLSAFVGPQLRLGWGGAVRSRSDWLALVLSVMQVALLVAIAIRAGRQRRRFVCALAALLALTSAVGLWSVTRIEGDIVDYAVFWLSGIGVLNLAVILNELLDLVWHRPVPHARPLAIAMCAALYLVVAATGVRRVDIAIERSAAPGSHELTAMRLSDQIDGYLRDHPVRSPCSNWIRRCGVMSPALSSTSSANNSRSPSIAAGPGCSPT
jgi:hypothetical protein